MNTPEPVSVGKDIDSSGPVQIAAEKATDSSEFKNIKTRTLTIEEMYARVRARGRITRGRFRAELRRAVKDGLVEITAIKDKGVCVVLTDAGMLAMGEELGK